MTKKIRARLDIVCQVASGAAMPFSATGSID
jgi:hypothetical protein